jgi:hypothetical protein
VLIKLLYEILIVVFPCMLTIIHLLFQQNAHLLIIKSTRHYNLPALGLCHVWQHTEREETRYCIHTMSSWGRALWRSKHVQEHDRILLLNKRKLVHQVGCKISILYHDAQSKIHQIIKICTFPSCIPAPTCFIEPPWGWPTRVETCRGRNIGREGTDCNVLCF